MLDIHILGILAVTGFVAGFIDSIAGGGGLITLPALLMTGLPPHLALGTGKLASTLGTFKASLAFIRKRIFDPNHWFFVMSVTAAGAFSGVLINHLFSADMLKKIIPIMLMVVIIYMMLFRNKKPVIKITATDFKPPSVSGSVLGAGLGFYDGFFGPGTGSLWASCLISKYKLDLLAASGIARLMNFVSNIIALIVFALFKSINYKFGLTMGLCLMLGAHMGAHSAIRFGNRFIRPVFLTVVIAIIIKLLCT